MLSDYGLNGGTGSVAALCVDELSAEIFSLPILLI